jgi:DHA1 family bicyclomycin/chloramphenicol resistance-like MFS transporter
LLLRSDTFALTALLAVLTTLGPMSIDLYLPSLPEIEHLLHASPAQAELTISAYLVGFAAGQIIYGPVSDRYGRKPVLLAALSLFCVTSLICASAWSIETLIAARVLQALGACGSAVLARAIVRDLHEGRQAARVLSLMATIFGIAPVVAPIIGGALQHAFGWRSTFVFIFAAGVLAIVAAHLLLPETLRARPSRQFAFVDLWRSYGVIARDRGFRIHLSALVFSYCGLFAWISASAFVLQDVYGVSPFGFAVIFALASIGYLIGTSAASAIVMRLGIERTIGLGASVLAAGGLLMTAAVALWPASPAALALPFAIYLAGLGLTMPQAMAGALHPFPEHAGAASSLLGFTQQTAAALMGALVGHALGSSAWPLVLGVAVMGCATLALWLLTGRMRAEAEMPAPPAP